MSYRQGTISVTNGSNAVVGTDTLFKRVGVTAGDQLTLTDANGLPTGGQYEVASVADDTHLTLLQNYQGTTGSGKAYAIIDMAGDSTVPNFARRLAEFYADISEGASPTIKGLVKLYSALGTNTDGALSQAAAKSLLDGKADAAALAFIPPVGTVLACASSVTPNGFLVCDGSAISRSTYSNLFAAIGTTYGGGNGSTTFNLPNLTDKFIQGNSTVGVTKTAGLPNITGAFRGLIRDDGFGLAIDQLSGAFYGLAAELGGYNVSSIIGPSSYGENYAKAFFDANRSSTIYGNSTTVQPPALTMKYCIKY